jgi:glycosyltransferase involved in cell wall biosynthesis
MCSLLCHISSLHGLRDDRIYWKEALSLHRAGYQVVHLGVTDRAVDEITPEGIRLIGIPRKRYFADPWTDILFRRLTFRQDVYRQLFRVCSELKADVYHIHDIQVNRIGAALQQLPHKPRIVYDVHEDYGDQFLSHFPRPGLRQLLARMYAGRIDRREASCANRYDAVIAAVDRIYAKFPAMAERGRAITLYNYTTMEPGTLRAPEEKSWDAVYAGQISEARGAMQVARAVAIARRQLPGIRVLLLGPVPDAGFRKALEDFIAAEGLKEQLVLGGQVPHDATGSYYNDSRVGLAVFLPRSIFEYGLQVKTFEYMAYGLPLLCSQYGSLYRIVTETGAGLAADPNAPEAIAEALVRLITDRELYEKCSRNALQAAEKYSWRSEEPKLLSLYRETLHLMPHA